MFSAKDLFFSTPGGYIIRKSLRFRGASSAYLNRTLGTPTLNTKLTFSNWIKRGVLGATETFFSMGESTGTANFFQCYFNPSDQLQVVGYTSTTQLLNVNTTTVFRDTTGWHHIVVAIDTTDATGANRVKVYVNGASQTLTATATIAQNTAIPGNVSGYINGIGAVRYNTAYTNFFDGHLAEINFIDGQALAATDFGQTNATTGAWTPKACTVADYGKNGCYLSFGDATSTTTLGYDTAPIATNHSAANNWTTTQISVTAGANYDSMIDTPTPYDDTGNGVGNYCVLSPLVGGIAPSNGNLTCNQAGAAYNSSGSSITLSSGKWYFEIGQSALSGANYSGLGLRPAGQIAAGEYAGSVSGAFGALNSSTGMTPVSSGVNGTTMAGTYTAATIFQCSVDFDAGKVWFGTGTSWIGGGSPSAGTTPTYTFTANKALTPYVSGYASATSVNFGQRAFTNTPPTGFKAINTQNLSAGTITTSGSFTGNGSADGPVVWLNGVPTAMTINSNAVTFGTHADKLAGGFKLRTTSASYNAAGSNTYSITTTGAKFKYSNAQGNP